MLVTAERLSKALDLVQRATAELVADKTFHHGALTRLRQLDRPPDVRALARKIGKKASAPKKGPTGAGMNGLTLDRRGKASLEALVLHYAQLSPGLFPSAILQIVRNKFAAQNGPKFLGPWP
jgi:hypothetical protein